VTALVVFDDERLGSCVRAGAELTDSLVGRGVNLLVCLLNLHDLHIFVYVFVLLLLKQVFDVRAREDAHF